MNARIALGFVSALLVSLVACGGGDGSSSPPADAGAVDAASVTDAAPDVDPVLSVPGANPDPQDVDPAIGDPSLDIAGSWIYFDAGQPWIRVAFYGAWPPDATLYAWSCQVFLSTDNAPVATYTVQSLSGTQTDYAEGIDKAKITFAVEPKGFRVLFADATLAFDRYALQCTSQKGSTSPLAQDDSGAFLVGNKESRTFGP